MYRPLVYTIQTIIGLKRSEEIPARSKYTYLILLASHDIMLEAPPNDSRRLELANIDLYIIGQSKKDN